MKKYYFLDNRGRRTISASAETAPMLDASVAFLVELWDISVSAAVAGAIVNYTCLMRGLDVEQAAAVLALARWLAWAAREQQK